MKNYSLFKAILNMIISICLLSSCSMEKRLYTNGYSFSWNRFNNSKNEQAFGKKHTVNEATTENDSTVEPTLTIGSKETSNSDYVEAGNIITASVDSSDIIPVLIMGDNNIENINFTLEELSTLKTDIEWKKFEQFKLIFPYQKKDFFVTND